MIALPRRILCLVTDLELAGGEVALVHAVKEAVRGGVNMVQVRGHELPESQLTQLATSMVGEVGEAAVVVVNSFPEIASNSGAAGVHFRENVLLDRASLKPGALAGQSVHSLDSAVAAQNAGADYVVLGTVFPSASHPGGTTGGVELVRSVASELRIPVIGIGGINAQNAAHVIAAGASGIAVISAIIGRQNPFEAATSLASAIELSD